MDIKCPNCGEPWDMDSLHEEIAMDFPDKPWKVNGKHDRDLYEKKYYNPMKQRFFKDGCKALGSICSAPKPSAAIYGDIYAEFGDDLDGVAAIMEDMGM